MSFVDRLAKCEDAEVREMAANMLEFPDLMCIASVRDGIALFKMGSVDDEPCRWIQRAVGDRRVHWGDKPWQDRVLRAADLAEEILKAPSI